MVPSPTGGKHWNCQKFPLKVLDKFCPWKVPDAIAGVSAVLHRVGSAAL